MLRKRHWPPGQAHEEGLTEAQILRQLTSHVHSIDATIEMEVRHLLQTITKLDCEASLGGPQMPLSTGITLPAASHSWSDNHLSSGTFCVGDATVAVQAPAALFREMVLPLLGHLMSASQHEPQFRLGIACEEQEYCLRINNQKICLASRDALIERMMFEILEVAYRSTPKLAVLHAAAIVQNEAALLFIGSQGSGKSTLVASLCAEGATYLADDLCPLDQSGRLLPIPAPQAIKEGSWTILEQSHPQLLESPIYQRFGRIRSIKRIIPEVDLH
jgi:hypothetical protein